VRIAIKMTGVVIGLVGLMVGMMQI